MNRRMKTTLLAGMLAMFCLLNAGAMHGQIPAGKSTADTTVVTFRFLPGQDMFYIPWAGNGGQLERLYALLDRYRTEITAGRMPVYVDGYCASMPTDKENLKTAFVRASRRILETLLRGSAHQPALRCHAAAYAGRGMAHQPECGRQARR